MTDRRVEYMALDAVQGAKRNPKGHAKQDIASSIVRFGYTEAILMDERTGRLVAGHGRLEALKGLRDGGTAAPDGIRAQDGDWLLPVQRGWASKDDTEAEALLLASNQLTTVGGWDEEGLKAILADLAGKGVEDGLGWSHEELEKLLVQVHQGGLTDPDDIPDEPTNVWVKTGDVFTLGGHRLLCGDSTKEADVSRLLAGEKPLMMVTDPPYGVEYDPNWREGQGDDRVDWSEAYRLFTGDVAYVWHAGVSAGPVHAHLLATGLEVRTQIIWVKQHFAFGRGAYHWQHEPCWYAVRKGGKANWKGDRKQTTVWEVQTAGGFGKSTAPEDAPVALAGSGRHGTQKPVELWRRPLVNHTEPKDLVYEPFSGSGTALIAAEQLGRRCLAMEIDPKYAQQAIERWEAFTGKKATKEAANGPTEGRAEEERPRGATVKADARGPRPRGARAANGRAGGGRSKGRGD